MSRRPPDPARRSFVAEKCSNGLLMEYTRASLHQRCTTIFKHWAYGWLFACYRTARIKVLPPVTGALSQSWHRSTARCWGIFASRLPTQREIRWVSAASGRSANLEAFAGRSRTNPNMEPGQESPERDRPFKTERPRTYDPRAGMPMAIIISLNAAQAISMREAARIQSVSRTPFDSNAACGKQNVRFGNAVPPVMHGI